MALLIFETLTAFKTSEHQAVVERKPGSDQHQAWQQHSYES